MLLPVSLPIPASWADLLDELRPQFRRRVGSCAVFGAGVRGDPGRRAARHRCARGGGDGAAVAAGLLVVLARVLGC